MSQPASVLHSVIHPKPPGQGPVVRPLSGKGPENAAMEEVLGETEDIDTVLGVLVENAPVAMALFDGRMRYVLANRQWINDFGLQQSLPLVGRSQYDVFPNLHPGWRSVYERALQGHVVRSEHDVMPGPQGKAMIFRWEVRPWRRSKDNSVGGVMVTCEKFAALSPVAEAPPREPGPTQPTLLESEIPILITNVQGLVLQANQAATRIALARGLQVGSSHFWEAFSEDQSHAPLRLEVLDVLARAASPGSAAIYNLTLRRSGEEASAGGLRWAVSLLEAHHFPATDQPSLLFVGLPVEEGPSAAVAPAQVFSTPAPAISPGQATPDAALQLENRRLEDQLAGAAREMHLLQEMEQAYKRRELRQREVLDAMPCGLIVLDERGRPTFHNAHVRSLFGCELKAGDTVEDWLMQACLDDGHREEVSTIWRESVWRRQLTKIVSLSTADGLVKDLEFRPTALGQAGLLLSIHDVTDTCRLEEMLRSTEAKFRAVLHESPVAAVLTDITGSIFEANSAAEKLLGHPKAELRRMGIDDWLSPESAQARRAEMQRMAGGRLLHGSLKVEIVAKNASLPERADLRLAAVFDGDGRLHSTIHYLQPEPVARVETIPLPVLVTPVPEESCLETEPPAAAAPVMATLLATDAQGRIHSWTPEAEALFGFAAAEACGRSLHQMFKPSDATGFNADIQALLQSSGGTVTWAWYGKGNKGNDTFVVRPNEEESGLALTLLLHGEEPEIPALAETPIPTLSASSNYIIGPTHSHPWPVADLEREQLLLTEAHHRIKNHLQIISSLLNLQSNSLDDASARQALRSSQNRVRAIASLHQHLYQLSLGGELSLQQFTSELVERLRECYDIPAEQVEVIVALDQCEVRDEWHMPLALILNEAISNAFKHAFPNGERGTIEIKLAAAAREAHLTIEDDGAGLGTKFDSTSSPGLGMKVIGVFAEQMKGQISMENITGRGLIFDLRFPIGCVDN
ncbi:MAG: hypothetical protein JWO94_1611 [Verrucomicrobiaceae bacterium]|nr:hypothetical protein [Verrucomicrobiaceae bacterium]